MTIIKNFDTQKQSLISTKYTILAVVFIGFLVILKIWVNNIFSSYGEKLDNTTRLQNALILENLVLENEVAKASSLHVVVTESQQLGFSGPKSIEYIP